MSMKEYPWDLEERTEDAIVAYLKQNVGSVAMISADREVVVAKFPLIRVGVQTSDNESNEAGPNGVRRLEVNIAIITEAVNENQELSQAELYKTAREAHRLVKNEVIGCLMGLTTHDDINAIGSQGITFSQCHCTTQTRSATENILVTEQMLDVIAQPKGI